MSIISVPTTASKLDFPLQRGSLFNWLAKASNVTNSLAARVPSLPKPASINTGTPRRKRGRKIDGPRQSSGCSDSTIDAIGSLSDPDPGGFATSMRNRKLFERRSVHLLSIAPIRMTGCLRNSEREVCSAQFPQKKAIATRTTTCITLHRGLCPHPDEPLRLSIHRETDNFGEDFSQFLSHSSTRGETLALSGLKLC